MSIPVKQKLICSIFLFFGVCFYDTLSVKAEWNYWAIKYIGNPTSEKLFGQIDLYKVNSGTGSSKFVTTLCAHRYEHISDFKCDGSAVGLDPNTGGVIIRSSMSQEDYVYDEASDKWQSRPIKGVSNWKDDYDSTYALQTIVSDGSGGVTIEVGGDKVIERKADGTIQIGSDLNDIDITSEGLSVGGSNLIRNSGGTVSIGENSLRLREQGGREQMWATDANGSSIDIDIVNSSDLLINGKSVQGQIDSNAANISTNTANISTNTANISTNTANISANAKNISSLGAGIAVATSLTTALSSLPAASADSPFSCGVGTGGYSDKFALGVGCAAKINQRLNANIAASHVFGGSVDYGEGSLDTVAARAGFVFKFGKIDDSPKVAARKAAELHDKVAKLEESNQALAATNQSLMKLLQAQSARLDNLEKIASGQLSLLGDRASSD